MPIGTVSETVPRGAYGPGAERWQRLQITPAPRDTERAWELVSLYGRDQQRPPSYVRLYFITGYGWIVDHVDDKGRPSYWEGIRLWPPNGYGWALLVASRTLDNYRNGSSIRNVPLDEAGPRLTLSPA